MIQLVPATAGLYKGLPVVDVMEQWTKTRASPDSSHRTDVYSAVTMTSLKDQSDSQRKDL